MVKKEDSRKVDSQDDKPRKKRKVLSKKERSDLINELLSGTEKDNDLAEKYGVSPSTVAKIKRDAKNSESNPESKTITVPTTQTQFDNAVRKLIYTYAKEIKNDHEEVIVESTVKIGSKQYTFDSLYALYEEKLEEKKKKDEALKFVKEAKEKGLTQEQVVALFSEA